MRKPNKLATLAALIGIGASALTGCATVAPQKAEVEPKYFLMTVTAYSRHPNCIAEKWNDGYTTTMTKVREGVAAINVDYIDDKWVVKSPLKLGQQIFIKGLGRFSVEDTGYFTDVNFKQDYWNVDLFMENHQAVVKFGRKLKNVYILEDNKAQKSISTRLRNGK